jgi:hypothetical protein
MMSIYQTRNKRPTSDDASQADTRDSASSAAFRPQNGQGLALDWSSRRKAEPVNRLLPASREWLGSLPADVQPMLLAAQYPRIVNLLAMEWANPTICRVYLAHLLADQRGDRKGFPADVQRDLVTLRDYFYTLHLTLAE